jgi:hypothetical protein
MASGQRPPIVGPGRPGRPPYPKWPLDPDCLEPGEPRPDVVELVRLVQTDFDPETDPTGWDSVADLVRGAGRPWDEVRQMDYHQLDAFFRVNHEAQKLRLGGAIETNTPSIASYNPSQASGQGVFRVGRRGRDTRKIDVDGALGKLETKLRKELIRELGSESAADAALVDRLYSLSAESLVPMLKSVGCKTSAKTIYRPGNSQKYESWGRYRKPGATAAVDLDVGPAALSAVRPTAADAADDAVNSGHLSIRSGGRGVTYIGKTAAEKAAEDAADRFAREAGIDLPPAE